MTSSLSGQDEWNPALWFATRAGKMELSCPLGTTRRLPQEKFPESHVINWLLTKLVRFFLPLSPSTRKKEPGQYPPILTSHLINNPYAFFGLYAGGEGRVYKQHFTVFYRVPLWEEAVLNSRAQQPW